MRQTPRLILNLTDNPLDPEDIIPAFLETPSTKVVEELKNIEGDRLLNVPLPKR